ncbi:MAG: PPOX class F420-dependent oxidoreductase [Anaerolineae bacterium]|jgi:PPOX class probable F420-dependent enzyme
MSAKIPESHKDLLEGPIYVTLATVMPDVQPHATVVWCSYDGSHVLVNTRRGTQKEKNMRERPMATIIAIDPQNPYRYLEVRGSVDEITEEGALDHINQLAQLYANKPTFYGGVAPAEMEDKVVRVICKIRPRRVRTVG